MFWIKRDIPKKGFKELSLLGTDENWKGGKLLISVTCGEALRGVVVEEKVLLA